MTNKYDIAGLDKYLSDLFKEKKLPGMAVAIRGPEGLIYEGNFGYRNVKDQTKVDTDTVFGIASMSKSFTTLALAILEVEGKVSYADPVYKYFPDFRIPGIPQELVLLKHLAMHTAGIPPIPTLEWSIAMNSEERPSEWSKYLCETAPNKMETIDQVVNYISAGDYGREGYNILGAPGEYMSYSNDGYAILSYIVDQVSGSTLEEFLEQRIFEPLDMNRTVLDVDGSEARKLAKGNITSLYEEVDGEILGDDHFSILPPFRGAACMKSTVRDLTKYYKMLGDGGRYEGKQIIPKRAVEILVGKAFPAKREASYCYGLNKRLFGGRIIAEHTGGLHGTSTCGGFIEGEENGFIQKDTGYGITVLCNLSNVDTDPFQNACYNLILGLPFDTDHSDFIPVEHEFSDLDALTGEYVAMEGLPQFNKVSVEKGKLTAVFQDIPVDLEYCGESKFIAWSKEKPNLKVSLMRFLIRNNKAWAVRCGSRIYQRIDGK